MERARGLAGSLFPLCPSRQTQLARFPSPRYVRCCSRCLVNRSFLPSHSDHSLCYMFPFSQMLADGNIDTYLNYPEYTSPLSLGPLAAPIVLYGLGSTRGLGPGIALPTCATATTSISDAELTVDSVGNAQHFLAPNVAVLSELLYLYISSNHC